MEKPVKLCNLHLSRSFEVVRMSRVGFHSTDYLCALIAALSHQNQKTVRNSRMFTNFPKSLSAQK